MRSIAKKTYRLLKIAWFCHTIVPVWHPGYLRVYSRALRICRQGRFEPYEAYRLGLFQPTFDESRLDNIISRKNMTKIQKRLNPESSAELTKNKGLFYYRCLERGIPVPRPYIVYQGQAGKWDRQQDGLLCERKDKIEYLEKHLPDKFVIKPLYGSYGKGVRVYSRSENGFIDNLGKAYKSAELRKFIESYYPSGFVMQQKIENHPAILELSGCEGLQTVRITTFVTGKGDVRLVHANFKPITQRNVVIDNLIEELTGNIEVLVEIESGILGRGNQIMSTGEGIAPLATHPITGKVFAGFKLPFWRQACELVKTVAPQFLPLRAIGWDVAIGPDHPYIIEGNVWWDPPNQHLRMNEILKLMRDDETPTDRLNEPQQRAISTNTRCASFCLRSR